MLVELFKKYVEMSPIFKEDQIKNALFPMEMKNKLHYYKNKHTMDTSSCQISVDSSSP